MPSVPPSHHRFDEENPAPGTVQTTAQQLLQGVQPRAHPHVRIPSGSRQASASTETRRQSSATNSADRIPFMGRNNQPAYPKYPQIQPPLLPRPRASSARIVNRNYPHGTVLDSSVTHSTPVATESTAQPPKRPRSEESPSDPSPSTAPGKSPTEAPRTQTRGREETSPPEQRRNAQQLPTATQQPSASSQSTSQRARSGSLDITPAPPLWPQLAEPTQSTPVTGTAANDRSQYHVLRQSTQVESFVGGHDPARVHKRAIRMLLDRGGRHRPRPLIIWPRSPQHERSVYTQRFYSDIANRYIGQQSRLSNQAISGEASERSFASQSVPTDVGPPYQGRESRSTSTTPPSHRSRESPSGSSNAGVANLTPAGDVNAASDGYGNAPSDADSNAAADGDDNAATPREDHATAARTANATSDGDVGQVKPGAILSMAMLYFLSQFPISVISSISPYIYQSLGHVDTPQRIVLTYILGTSAFCPLFGHLFDRIGRRSVALSGPIISLTGLVICICAESTWIFIVGTALAGCGGGISEMTALAAISELVSTARRGFYTALVVFPTLLCSISSLWVPWISLHRSWRYGVATTLPFPLLTLGTLWKWYRPTSRTPPRDSSRQPFLDWMMKSLDIVGVFFSMVATICCMFAMQLDQWHPPMSASPLAIGFLAMFGLILWHFIGPNWLCPICVPLEQSTNRSARVKEGARTALGMSLVLIFLAGATFSSITLFWSTQVYNVYNRESLWEVGIRGLPPGALPIGSMAGLIFFDILRRRNAVRATALVLGIAAVLMEVGCTTLSRGTPENFSSLSSWTLALAAFGFGALDLSATVLCTLVCEPGTVATFTAFTIAARAAGSSLGYMVYHPTLDKRFFDTATDRIKEVLAQSDVSYLTEDIVSLTYRSLPNSVKSLLESEGAGALYNQVIRTGQQAFSKAYTGVYLRSCIFGVFAVILALSVGLADFFPKSLLENRVVVRDEEAATTPAGLMPCLPGLAKCFGNRRRNRQANNNIPMNNLAAPNADRNGRDENGNYQRGHGEELNQEAVNPGGSHSDSDTQVGPESAAEDNHSHGGDRGGCAQAHGPRPAGHTVRDV